MPTATTVGIMMINIFLLSGVGGSEVEPILSADSDSTVAASINKNQPFIAAMSSCIRSLCNKKSRHKAIRSPHVSKIN